MFLLMKLSRIHSSVLGSLKQISRNINFLSKEERTADTKNYMRKILMKTDGCILFNPSRESILRTDYKIEDKSIANLASIIIKLGNLRNAALHKKVLAPINDYCVQNYKTWPIDKQLFTLDVWDFARDVKENEFFNQMLYEFLNKFSTLSNGPALQVMYYVARTKKQLNANEISKIEEKLKRISDQLTLDELSIYCTAFIMSQTKIENTNLIKSFYKYLLQNDLSKFDDIAVTGILKAIRRFSTPEHLSEMKELQTKLIPYAKKASLLSLAHIIQFGYRIRVCNFELLDVVIRRFLAQMNELRIKEVERASLVIAIFDFRTPDRIEDQFCEKVKQFLLKSLETKFPSSAIRCIAYLMIRDSVDTKLIDWALSTTIPSNNFNDSIFSGVHTLLLIDSYAKINLAKTYDGYRLSDDLCASLIRQIPEGFAEGHNIDILNDITEIFQSNQIHSISYKAIPHFPLPDIIFLYNKRTNKTIDFVCSNKDGKILNATDLHKNDPDLTAVAIVPCSWRQTIFNSNKYHGYFQLKLNQLKLIGFKVIVIRYQTWKQYTNIDAKRRFITLELCQNDVFVLNKCFDINYSEAKK